MEIIGVIVISFLVIVILIELHHLVDHHLGKLSNLKGFNNAKFREKVLVDLVDIATYHKTLDREMRILSKTVEGTRLKINALEEYLNIEHKEQKGILPKYLKKLK